MHATSHPDEKSKEISFTPSRFFVLRTPLLPFEELERWGQGLEAARLPPDAELAPALQKDRALLRTRLQELLRLPEVREALFVASPGFCEHLAHWERAPESERGEKLERGLMRYLTRMVGRPTPFGLFAGYSVGELGEHTRLRTGPRAAYHRHTRLDMDYACMLAEAFSRAPALRPHIPHRPSTSLYRTAGRLRYAEGRLSARSRAYHLVVVEPSEHLDAVLERARDGARPEELVQALREMDPELPPEEATGYITELIDSQILVSELTPPVTGSEALPELISQLQQLPGTRPFTETLGAVQSSLEHLDRAGIGAPSERYLEVARMLGKLPAPVELPRLFQVDMAKPAPEATLGRDVLRELERGARVLHRITPTPPQDALDAFREAFLRRYEGREVPLLEALDEESGVPFMPSHAPGAEAVPILAGLALGGPAEGRASFGERSAFLLHKLEETWSSGAHVLALGDADLEHLEARGRAPLPDSFMAMATVVAASEEAIGRGRYQLRLHMVSGPSGANTLGRFCQGDVRLRREVEEHLRAEEALRPDAVFAEIVHLPQGRVGNILARPVMRGHEITYLGRSGAQPEQQIDASDLRLSVQGRRLVLRSARLGLEVIPRMTNAHNYGARSLGLYRFLCALPAQGTCGGLTWSWGPLAHSRFLPRVTHGRLVLSAARWNFWGDTLQKLGVGDATQRFATLQALRAERRLPRFVALEEGDQLLPIDLDNVLSVETLIHLLKERPRATLVEQFPGPQELCAEGPEGRFIHELVVPFVRTRPTEPARLAPQPTQAPTRPAPATLPRAFLPGSEWLYAKLYTGSATADRLLTDVVAPLVRSALGSGAANGWFFIRYGDPDWHLRLRFHGTPPGMERLARELSEAMSAPHRERLLWKVQFDTYEREVERYGGPEAMLLVERLFQMDSEAVLQLLELLPGDSGADARWRLMLHGMDRLMGDLGLGLEEKLSLVNGLRAGFGREFQAGRLTERQLGERFRKERSGLEELLSSRRVRHPVMAMGQVVLQRRSERMAPITSALRTLAAAGTLRVPLLELAGSLLHMHANRLARASARAQELVLYDLLGRHYASQAARQRKSLSTAKESIAG